MAKVRLVSKEWESFSSYLGMTKFKNGVSESDVSPNEIRILGAITKIEVEQPDGEYEASGPADIAIAVRTMPAPIIPDLKAEGARDERKEITPEDVVINGEKATGEESDEKDDLDDAMDDLEKSLGDDEDEDTSGDEEIESYTKEQLEAIADEKGIAGLREIGDANKVKSNSIESLIEKILHAQKVREA